MGYERFSPVERRFDVQGTPITVWQPPDIDALIDVEAAFDRRKTFVAHGLLRPAASQPAHPARRFGAGGENRGACDLTMGND